MSHTNLGDAQRFAGDHRDAIESYRQAIGCRIRLARLHQALNQPAEAVRVARECVAIARGNPADLYHVAGALARSVPLARNEQQSALAAEAVQLLKEAVAAGWSDAGTTSRDLDLVPLHDRDDFRHLLAELFDRRFPADPFAP
jgi:hypothetical protein